MRSARAVLLLLALLPALALAADEGEVQTVEADGDAAIGKGDRAMAKDKAVESALRHAVEQACGALVVSETKVEGNTLVSDKILSQARGYVKSYDVLSSKEERGVVTVRIKATVGTSKLADDLAAIGLTLLRKGMPRIALLVSEQRIDDAAPAAHWAKGDGKQPVQNSVDQRVVENTLLGEWTKKGFLFVDNEALASNVKVAGVVSADITADQARSIGDRADADVVIYGRALAKKTQDMKDLLDGVSHGAETATGVACSATLSVRAINADSGDVLAAAEETAAARDQSPLACGRKAMVAATTKLSEKFQGDLLNAWNRQVTSGGRLKLKVSGLDSFSTLNAFTAGIKQGHRGVTAVNQKNFKGGNADVDVMATGSAEELAAFLDGKTFNKRKVKVVSMSANQIEVTLSK